ncbi:phytanoyl-CoA dioxygenase family protein [Dietzia sp.]|uniref:phytanoyl-CoA dioxygenase family protein n=1 Tax=Dietzia sp. TaxID=1871616 RepID=UPI002FD99A7D
MSVAVVSPAPGVVIPTPVPEGKGESGFEPGRTLGGKRSELRSIFDVHVMSPLVDSIARDPRVLDRARAILGSEVYVHQSRINHMPGFVGNGFHWHSDFETWHAEDGLPRPRAVSLSLALSDNYPFNGGLMLLPGSHRHFIPCGGPTPAENHQKSLVAQESGVPSHADMTELVAECDIDQFTGSAGDGLWFDSNIVHGSGSNITPYQRSNIFLVFNSVENAPERPFDGTERRPEYIASTRVDPLR